MGNYCFLLRFRCEQNDSCVGFVRFGLLLYFQVVNRLETFESVRKFIRSTELEPDSFQCFFITQGLHIDSSEFDQRVYNKQTHDTISSIPI